MKTILITTLLAVIIGFFIGVGVTIFYYPYLFPPAQVNEQITQQDQKALVANGQFYDQSKDDGVHWGRGTVSIYKSQSGYELLLHKNFHVGPGPAFHVYLAEADNIKNNASFKNATSYDLGKLKSFQGSQVYKIPSDIDFSKIKSVVVWCKVFSQYITSADLLKK